MVSTPIDVLAVDDVRLVRVKLEPALPEPVVTPSRTPASTSARLTHSFSVCGTQPIFGAMDSMAAHSDGYSPRCSCTILTARSRTLGENLSDCSWLNPLRVLSLLETQGG